jgi:hypothetical protein
MRAIAAFLAAVILISRLAGAMPPGPGGPGVDPLRSTVGVSGQGSPCQFRFHPDGTEDVLSVNVTLRDSFDNPVAGCSTSVTLVPVGPDTFNFCSCCGPRRTGFSGADGTVAITWSSLGGFGSLEARVTTHCGSRFAIGAPVLNYTSTDLSGDCTATGSTSIVDWALWARGLPPNVWQPADWDCSGGSADLFDAGNFAFGYGTDCGCP